MQHHSTLQNFIKQTTMYGNHLFFLTKTYLVAQKKNISRTHRSISVAATEEV
jgi:hypothetical protein